ncbi:hypothetical protein AAFF_G00270050 [Aldrovandia affinis]|uniref:C2H2-type domain-containing protein n=1 Tax=Aldrovandia affinis TaxID=143900 RepID=A0AAD7SUB7_9TELE|nr:hypothetical protein AAFF_G00270050 [Aldrovandia affinis]
MKETVLEEEDLRFTEGAASTAGARERSNAGVAGRQRPFQCRYCPYSASQKGNLKTHVLCVHRMPFDNSQYPDRRFKRSRVDSEPLGSSEEGNLATPLRPGDHHRAGHPGHDAFPLRDFASPRRPPQQEEQQQQPQQ